MPWTPKCVTQARRLALIYHFQIQQFAPLNFENHSATPGAWAEGSLPLQLFGGGEI